MAHFKWVGQKNHIDPSIEDRVIEFRANLRGIGYTSHFPIDPEGFAAGEALRAPGVRDPSVADPYDFNDDDYRLRHMRIEPKIQEVIPEPVV